MMSSESDGYGESETGSMASARQRNSHSRRGRTSTRSGVGERVDTLTSSLRETNRNLEQVGDLLGQYRGASSRQNSAIDRLRSSLNQAHRQDRSTRLDSDTMSASELRSGFDSRHRRSASASVRQSRPSVRFSRDADEVHEIHRDLRDLGRDQSKLMEELNQERRQRHRVESDNRSLLLDLSDSVKRSARQDSKPSERVEKRLQDLQEELRQQRESVSKRYRDAQDRESIRTDVRETILNASREEDRELRSRLTQVEAERQKLASELESTKRRLEQSEGGASVLHNHVETLRRDLSRSDDDRQTLKSQLTSLKDSFHEDNIPLTRRERQHRAKQESDVEKQQETSRLEREIHSLRAQLKQASSYYSCCQSDVEKQQETSRLEREIHSLRAQLKQASSLREYEEQRKELERSLRQREQLSEHIDTLNRELDSKDKHQGKLLAQLKDATDGAAETQHQRQVALSQLEDLEARLKQKTGENEASLRRARESEKALTENQKKTEDRHKKLLDIVKHLKSKCKKLERERESSQQTSSLHLDRTEELVKENETLKAQRTSLTHKLDSLQREISDVLERLARQDEQLRVKDIEVNELKSSCMKLDQELRDNRSLTDQLDTDLRGEQARYMSLSDEKLRLAQQLDTAKAGLHDAQSQNRQTQKELRELTKQNAEMTARASELSVQKKESERQLNVTEDEKQNIKQDLSRLDTKFREVQDFNAALTDKLHNEVQSAKENEERIIQDLIRKQKRERAESEAEIQALKIESAESRSSAKSLRRQLDRGTAEMDKMRDEIRKLDDENIKLRRNYDRIRAGFEEQAQLAEVGDSRASVLEKHLQRLESTIQAERLDHENAVRGLVREVDTLVGLVSESSDDGHSPEPFSRSQDSPDAMLSDVKNKLYWLQKEVRRQTDQRLRLRDNLNRSRGEVDEVRRHHLADRYAYENHLDRTEDVIRDLQYEKQDLKMQNVERIHTVQSLERQIGNMEDHIRVGSKILDSSFEALREPERLPAPAPSSSTSEFDRLMELEKERKRIEEKYTRYQTTVAHLHQQLDESKRLTDSTPSRDGR